MPRLLTQRHLQDGKTVQQLIGMLSGFTSERCPAFDRNPVRLIPGIRRLYGQMLVADAPDSGMKAL